MMAAYRGAGLIARENACAWAKKRQSFLNNSKENDKRSKEFSLINQNCFVVDTAKYNWNSHNLHKT